jgi:hypothetical protein
MSSCSVCGSETSLQMDGAPICPTCGATGTGKAARTCAEVNEALMWMRQEHDDALAGPSWRSRRHRGQSAKPTLALTLHP